MSIQKLPSGRWRAQVYHQGRNVSVSEVLGGPGTFATKTEAKQARAKARDALAERRETGVTVREFRERWIADPLFTDDKKTSTIIRNREGTEAFVARYGDMPIGHVGDLLVAEWLATGVSRSTVAVLCAMFNAAGSAKAGRLVKANPFARLGIGRGRGRRDQQPPSEETVWALIGHARELTSDFFAGWLQVAAFTGLRPAELDALRWDNVDLERQRIRVVEQYSSKSRRSRPRRTDVSARHR